MAKKTRWKVRVRRITEEIGEIEVMARDEDDAESAAYDALDKDDSKANWFASKPLGEYDVLDVEGI